MDIDGYLKNLESDLRQRQEELSRSLGMPGTNVAPLMQEHELPLTSANNRMQFCPYCGNRIEAEAMFCPCCGARLESEGNDTLVAASDNRSVLLEHYEELEDASKTKIATFEKLVNSMQDELPTYGFDDKDYSQYVALLSGVVELECNASVYAYERKLHHYRNSNINTRSGEILLKKEHLTLRELTFNMRNDARLEKVDEVSVRHLAENIDEIASTRNNGMHGKVVDRQMYDSFYKSFCLFYKSYLPQLFKLKSKLTPCQRKYSPVRYSNQQEVPVVDIEFSEVDRFLSSLRGVLGEDAAQCGELLEKPVRSGAMLDNCSGIRRGVILTNTDRLIGKYDNVSYQDIMALLNAYAQVSHMAGNDYEIIDMASPDFFTFINKDFTWQNHLLALDSIAERYSISPEEPWALFIVGGDDVVPMPTVESPFGPQNRRQKINLEEADVDTDLPYAYRSCDVKVMENGLLSFDTLLHYTIGPRFIVGRLPMESGKMETTLANDLGGYLNKVGVDFAHIGEDGKVADGEKPGYDLNTSLTTVASRFMENGSVVSKTLGLPACEDIDGIRCDGLYLSPVIDTEREDLGEFYLSEITDKDMLLYVTHSGSGNSDWSASFIGDDGGGVHPLTLQPMMLPSISAKAIVPVCCWGGRYKNYRRTRSMLLMAMYHSRVLTYLGSSRSAHAAMEGYLHNADAIVTFFADYLMQGLNAGEALTRARFDLLHSLPDERCIPSALLTFIEFNLFGDPLVYGHPTKSRRDMAEVVRGALPDTDIPLVDEAFNRYSLEYSKEDGYNSTSANRQSSMYSLLERVRSLVDGNLRQIREKVDCQLYNQYHVEPRHLNQIFSYQTSSNKKEYIFCYSNRDYAELNLCTYAYVADNGRVLGVEVSY